MYETSCHGINLRSTIPLPLPLGETLAGVPELNISLAELPAWKDLPFGQETTRWGLSEGFLLIQWGRVRFRVGRQNLEIGGDLSGIDPGDWAVRLALGFAVQQESAVAFHGSAVAGPVGAIILVGDKGAGKSTTAWGLVQRGWTPLSDDTAVLSEQGRVWPGACRFRLCSDVCERLGLTQGAPDTEAKFSFEPSARGEPTPLKTILVLGAEEVPRPTVRPLLGYEKLRALFPHIYSPEGVGNPQLRQSRVLAAAAVPMFSVRRPAQHFALEEVLDLVESLVRSPS